jgi:hypothetical protein
MIDGLIAGKLQSTWQLFADWGNSRAANSQPPDINRSLSDAGLGWSAIYGGALIRAYRVVLEGESHRKPRPLPLPETPKASRASSNTGGNSTDPPTHCSRFASRFVTQ